MHASSSSTLVTFTLPLTIFPPTRLPHTTIVTLITLSHNLLHPHTILTHASSSSTPSSHYSITHSIHTPSSHYHRDSYITVQQPTSLSHLHTILNRPHSCITLIPATFTLLQSPTISSPSSHHYRHSYITLPPPASPSRPHTLPPLVVCAICW